MFPISMLRRIIVKVTFNCFHYYFRFFAESFLLMSTIYLLYVKWITHITFKGQRLNQTSTATSLWLISGRDISFLTCVSFLENMHLVLYHRSLQGTWKRPNERKNCCSNLILSKKALFYQKFYKIWNIFSSKI